MSVHEQEEPVVYPHPRFRWGRAILAFFVGGALAMPLVYGIAVTIQPPITSDGHPVMPIGQAFLGMIAGPVIGSIVAWRVGKRS